MLRPRQLYASRENHQPEERKIMVGAGFKPALVAVKIYRFQCDPRKPKNARRLAHLWAFFFPAYLFAAATFDSIEVTNGEYLKFVVSTRHAAPEYWNNGRFPSGQENDPVVLVNFHDATAYCRWIGKRLPSVDEWKSTCEGGKLKKRGDIWEWTSTDVDMGGQIYKALCGPANTCDCSHRYLPEWKNQVKGFRCVQDSTPVTWLRELFEKEMFL